MKKTSLSPSDFEMLRSISVNNTPQTGDRRAVIRLLQRELLAWVWGRLELTPQGERFLEILHRRAPAVAVALPGAGVSTSQASPIFENASSC